MIQTVKEINIKDKKRRIIKESFDSITDLVNYIKMDKPVNNVFKNEKRASRKHETGSFNEYPDFASAVYALEYGDDKHIEELEKNIKKVKEISSKYRIDINRKFKSDIIGFMPIVPNTIKGIPKNMLNQEKSKKKKPYLNIILDLGVTARFDTEEIIKYTSMIYNIIELLENRGIRCELNLMDVFCESNEFYCFKVKLKEYMQPFNSYKVKFPLVSPDMFRRIGFDLLETSTKIEDNGFSFGYGTTLKNKVSMFKDDYKLEKEIFPIYDMDKEKLFIPSWEVISSRVRDKNSEKEILETLIETTGLKEFLEI